MKKLVNSYFLLSVLTLITGVFPLYVEASVPFTCSTDAYIFTSHGSKYNPTDVYSVDLASGTYTLDANDINPTNINAIGYNVTDNYIWGYDKITEEVKRVDKNYNVTAFTIPGLPEHGYHVGDVSVDGILYLFTKFYDNAKKIYKVDVNPSSPTYLQMVGTINLSTALFTSDFSFHPKDNMIYFPGSSNLYKIDTATGIIADLGDMGVGSWNYFVATFFDVDGYFYIQKNDGTVYQIDITDPANPDPAAATFSTFAVTTYADGARCPNAAISEPPSFMCEGAFPGAISSTDISIDILSAEIHGTTDNKLIAPTIKQGVQNDVTCDGAPCQWTGTTAGTIAFTVDDQLGSGTSNLSGDVTIDGRTNSDQEYNRIYGLGGKTVDFYGDLTLRVKDEISYNSYNTINVKYGTVVIYTDKFEFDSGTTLNIDPDSRLIIVANTFDFNSGTGNNYSSPNQFIVLAKDKLEMDSGGTLQGLFYSDDKLNIRSGGEYIGAFTGADVDFNSNNIINYDASAVNEYCGGSTSANTISGTIYNETVGNTLSNITVHLYEGSTLTDTQTTDASGEYSFDAPAGNYSVVVDSKTIGSYPNSWAEQTHAPKGGLCSDGSGGTQAPLADAGVCYGGKRGNFDDDASTLSTAEHIAQVEVSGSDVGNVNFGFSFNAVTSTEDAGQGSLRQFIKNANAISGSNVMKFAPSVVKNETNWWSITLNSPLPEITDNGTTIDGAAQDNDNAGSVGHSGEKVGTGDDGLENSGDEDTLPNFNKPELEINANDQLSSTGHKGVFIIKADNIVIKHIAIYNGAENNVETSSTDSGILIHSGADNIITDNLIGCRADGSNPGDGQRLNNAIYQNTNSATQITNNYIAFTAYGGIWSGSNAYIAYNELYQASNIPLGDAITTENSNDANIIIEKNRIEGAAAYGIESWESPSIVTIRNNTLISNGQDTSGANEGENGGIRVFGTSNVIEKNIIKNHPGAGIVVTGSENGNKISKNVIYNNGGLSIDIDTRTSGNRNGDGVTPNNGTISSSKPNKEMDYPIFTNVSLAGTTLHLEGYVGTELQKVNGSHTVEVYKADDDGNNNGEVVSGDGKNEPHGEGRWYLGIFTTNSDGTFDADINNVNFTETDLVTATAMDTSNNTSEFSANYAITENNATIIAEYRFDECIWDGAADEVKDSSSNNFHGTAMTRESGKDLPETSDIGKINRSGKFTMSEKHFVKVAGFNNFNHNTFSTSMWVKVHENINGWQTLLHKGSSNNATNGVFRIKYNYNYGNDKLGLYTTFADNSSTSFYKTNIGLDDKQWHHLVVTYRNSEYKIYLDNNLVTSQTYTKDLKDPNSELHIGGKWYISNMYIDEVKLFDGTLNSEQIQSIYNDSGSDRDSVVCGANISGYIYNDKNQNQKKDADENGTLQQNYIKLCQNSSVVDSYEINISNENGYYQFADVENGSYKLLEDTSNSDDCNTTSDPDGWSSTTPNILDINVSGTDIVDVNFGDYKESIFDYGDLPFLTLKADNGASHDISDQNSTIYLGATEPDGESDGQPDNDASLDGAEDDGVKLNGLLLQGQIINAGEQIELNITTHGNGYLNAWIDWNRDGDFNSTLEQIADGVNGSSGKVNLSINVPFNLSADGITYARFRYGSQNDLNVTGTAIDGEVEDYKLEIQKDEGVPFTCDETMYLSNRSQIGTGAQDSGFTWLHTINTSANPFSFPHVGGGDETKAYNALGYNPIDDYMYAMYGDELLRIDSSGQTISTETVEGISDQQYSGTFDRNGNYYVGNMGSDSDKIYQIDINQTKVVRTITLSKAITYWDFTVDQNDEYLYLVQASGSRKFTKVNISSGEVLEIGNSHEEPDMDSIYSDNNGRVFGLAHENGFYEFNSATGEKYFISDTPELTFLNDGANCPDAAFSFYDYDDAPSSYGIAKHYIDHDIKLGKQLDHDNQYYDSDDALGDDNTGIDDEDSVVEFSPLRDNFTEYSVTVNVTNQTGDFAYLTGWIDFDKNGQFDMDEDITETIGTLNSVDKNVTLTWSIPSDIQTGNTFARLRFASTANIGATGEASNGEVEDYTLTILPGGEFDAWDIDSDITNKDIKTKVVDKNFDLVLASVSKDGSSFEPNSFENVAVQLISDKPIGESAIQCFQEEHFSDTFPKLFPDFYEEYKHSDKIWEILQKFLEKYKDKFPPGLWDKLFPGQDQNDQGQNENVESLTEYYCNGDPKPVNIQDINSTTITFNTNDIPAGAKESRVAIVWIDEQNQTRVTVSSDNFAIRPDRFDFTLSANGKAGENFDFKVEAKGYTGTVVDSYNEHDSYEVDFNETKANCQKGLFKLYNDGNISYELSDVNFSTGKIAYYGNYDEAGEINFKINEIDGKEFAFVDKDDTNDSERFITPSVTNMTFIPKKFNVIWSLTDKNSVNDFTYYSDDFENMSAEIDLTLSALNANGVKTENYDKECYSQDTNTTVKFATSGIVGQGYRLQFKDEDNITHSSDITIGNDSSFAYDINLSKFSSGETNQKLKLNFKRDKDKRLEPMKFSIHEINATDKDSISGAEVKNETVTFYYARLHTPDYKKVGNNINAALFYEIYCKDCDRNTFILAKEEESKDSVYWYIVPNVQHSSLGSYTNPESIYGTNIDDAASDDFVLKLSTNKTPHRDRIVLEPDEWLIHDPYQANEDQYSFKVEFGQTTSTWGGRGKLGFTVDLNVSRSRRNYMKMDW